MPKVSERVMDTVRRAVRLTFIHAKEAPDLGELATSLGCDEITPATLATWAKEEDWAASRDEVLGLDAVREEDARRRRHAAQHSLESLHNLAVRSQRVLRPKSWEAAASVQMRCAETLRMWADEDARRQGSKDDASDKSVQVEGADVPNTWSNMSEQEWQDLAHAALSRASGDVGDGTPDKD